MSTGSARRRIVVAGMYCGDPRQGGAVWATLQWVHGFRALGHDVVLVDHLPPGRPLTSDVVACFGAVRRSLHGHARVVAVTTDDEGDVSALLGAEHHELRSLLGDADVLVNLSGRLRLHDMVTRVPARVFVDLDPGFVQVWASQGCDLGIEVHTHTATVGTAVGTPSCPVPTLGRTWLHVLPPVSLAHWPERPLPYDEPHRLTTVANLRSYGRVEWHGELLGQKVHSLRSLRDLGRRSPLRLELAMSVDGGDLPEGEALRDGGWSIVEPDRAVGTPRDYQRFVRHSCGEIGVAKHGYVSMRTGWVSDRSAAYLATGRPVVLQDTGAAVLRDRDGVLLFDDVDGAVAAIERLVASPVRQARAARAIAEELFDARRVLGTLLDAVAA